MSINPNWEFLSLLEPYYEELDSEKEFRRVNESQIMPSFEDYNTIVGEISWDKIKKFYEFLQIYAIFWEVEKFEDFTLEIAKKVLISLNNDIFRENPKSKKKSTSKQPKYATFSLIEKFKINIAYQISKSTSNDEISEWLLISEDIRNKWKEIDMKSLMKSGCNFYMNYNGNTEIADSRILILLNKFIGRDKKYRQHLAIYAYNWLDTHYDADHWTCKAILSALKNNPYKFSTVQNEKIKEIQNAVGYWKYDTKNEIKRYQQMIKNWINKKGNKAKTFNIISKSEILDKSEIAKNDSKKLKVFRCNYKISEAVLKEYEVENFDNSKIKGICEEIAISIFLSKNNVTNIFMHYIGWYFEKKENRYCIGILMEDCDKTLYDYINKVDETLLNEIIDKLLGGFFLLHNLGLAHNDIKPQNIFIKKIGNKIQPKIADYDISSAFSSNAGASVHKTVSAVQGTAAFMAPEVQKLYKRKVKVMKINKLRADVFSLGIVFLWLKIKKDPPIGPKDRKDYIKREMKDLDNPWLAELLKSMLVYDPRERKKFGELIKLKEKIMPRSS
ncbi:unnamed protein product [Blepharisma stoltei]|uniref:Protein kinase domain-containing protein n=1 Tax=Blepharisma stoltei TaxID=1481888 RepID=A0AAU9JXP0_9CILI|nr:unnamed protein product [Blepharisma stoltei]